MSNIQTNIIHKTKSKNKFTFFTRISYWQCFFSVKSMLNHDIITKTAIYKSDFQAP